MKTKMGILLCMILIVITNFSIASNLTEDLNGNMLNEKMPSENMLAEKMSSENMLDEKMLNEKVQNENTSSENTSNEKIPNENNIVENEIDENVIVNRTEGYTNDLIYNENYDYSLSYDEEDNFETMSLAGIVLEASEALEHDNGYATAMAQDIKVKITDSRHKDAVYNIIYYLEDDYNTRLPMYKELKAGDKVYVYANFQNGELVGEAFVQYYDKTGWMLFVVALFAVAIILIGGKKGIKALIGLIITIALVFYILIPGILEGKNPITLTILVCFLTIFATFLIVSGFHKKTVAAILGTVAGVVAAGLIGGIFSDLMQLTGINEHARMLSVAISQEQEMFDFNGIMLAGIMISALGACMDVGMSIASSLAELKKENPDMTAGMLIKSGMNIGKDVMGTMTNTLILAYVGSSLFCILLYTIHNFDLVTVLNQEDIAMEFLQSLAGSIGLVCTIPLTALVSGLIMGTNLEEKLNPKRRKDFSEDSDEEEVKIRYFKG